MIKLPLPQTESQRRPTQPQKKPILPLQAKQKPTQRASSKGSIIYIYSNIAILRSFKTITTTRTTESKVKAST